MLGSIQQMAVTAFQAVECWGMARVDFFLTSGGQVRINEINTIPGFTSISMYPKLWEASGLAYADLIDRLLDLAQERHAAEESKSTTAAELER
jgi:D-alanine-D-alanine ligase